MFDRDYAEMMTQLRIDNEIKEKVDYQTNNIVAACGLTCWFGFWVILAMQQYSIDSGHGAQNALFASAIVSLAVVSVLFTFLVVKVSAASLEQELRATTR